MKPKEQKQLEAQYRNLCHEVKRIKGFLERLQNERDMFDNPPSWRKGDRDRAEADLAVAKLKLLELDSTLRAKGYWYNPVTDQRPTAYHR